MGDKQKKPEEKKPALERRSNPDRREDDERRGPLRWDPGNKERRRGDDRRRPGYMTDQDTPVDSDPASDPED